MTDLLERAAAPTPVGRRWRLRAPNRAVRRTLVGYLASALGALPLCTLLSDRGWLLEVWAAMLVVLAPALVMRMRRPPSATQIWIGVLLLVPWLTVGFVPQHDVLGLPTRATLHQLSRLMANLHDTAHDGVAPVHSTVAIRLAVTLILALVAALVDLIAVVGRHGALAGVPLLIVFSAAGAAPHRSVGWLYFLGPAVAFLLLLGLDARDDRADWGHWVGRPGRARGTPASRSGARIAGLTLVCALVLPLLSPAGSTSLLADLLKHSGVGKGTGFGPGGSIDPFAALKGELDRSKTATLAHVTVQPAGADPSYLRVNVLTKFTPTGWVAGSHGSTVPAVTNRFDTTPITGNAPSEAFAATIDSTGMSGNPPVFNYPQALSGVPGVRWSPQDQLLLNASFAPGEKLTELTDQPDPSVAELRAAPDVDAAQFGPWLALPSIPASVHRLVNRLIATAQGPYAKALAIFDFFANPANGFVYSLQTAAGDSGNELVDFLTNRIGYCQQYAAAMGVMLRLAGVPARVVLGYAHAKPNRSGEFTVTTDDAHAWVEAYFANLGWIPFDPTPASGIAGGHAEDPPWAKHPTETQAPTGSSGPTSRRSSGVTGPSHHPSSQAVASTSSGPGGGLPTWPIPLLVVAVLAGVAAIPFLMRTARRRSRLAAGDPDALWAELRDTALDLGFGWSAARTPRQVVRWLSGGSVPMRAALGSLAGAVEQQRYSGAASTAGGAELARELHRVTGQLWSRRGRRQRLLARMWPASLQLSGRMSGLLRPARRH